MNIVDTCIIAYIYHDKVYLLCDMIQMCFAMERLCYVVECILLQNARQRNCLHYNDDIIQTTAFKKITITSCRNINYGNYNHIMSQLTVETSVCFNLWQHCCSTKQSDN